ncbi:MAG TPA: KH domain-containing protein [Acidobacteriaceae bacterium]|nr:KH domain-containing protein [Acidobacteriaceae bacterium]
MSNDPLEQSPSDLIAEIARALVDAPDQVEISSAARDVTTVLRLHVAPGDVGKVIGKQGRTARSLRTILSAVSMKLHHRYTLEILEEGPPGAGGQEPPTGGPADTGL